MSRPYRILVADESLASLSVLSHSLNNPGYAIVEGDREVISCDNLQIARVALEKCGPIDLLIGRLHYPLDKETHRPAEGRTWVHELIDETPHRTGVIVLSDRDDALKEIKAVRPDAEVILTTPYKAQQLQEAIVRLRGRFAPVCPQKKASATPSVLAR